MPFEFYDVRRLAAYLQILPQRVQHYAEQGKIPGQRVGGEWRFSRSEIHRWMEQQIFQDSVSDIHVENVINAPPQGVEVQDILVSDLLLPTAIKVPLTARSQSSVIDEMVELAMNTGLLWDPDKMKNAICEREAMYPTAMENGVALMHPRRPLTNILGDPFLALGRSWSGIPFTGGGRVLTDIFFLICSTTDHQHLRTLARLSHILLRPGFLSTLRTLETQDEILAHFRETEVALGDM